MMNESLVKYLAGLLDADGALSFAFAESRCGTYSNLVLQLKLSSSKAVDKHGFVASLPALTGLGYTHRWENDRFTGWHVNKSADLEKLLPRVIKHMIIKARHWQWLLDVWRERKRREVGKRSVSPDEREQIRQASKESRRTMAGPLKPKNHPTWAWLAGYLDGDGCYSDDRFKSGRHRMLVTAVAHVNDMCALTFLQNAFGGSIIDHSQSANVKLWYRSLGAKNRSFALRFLPNLVKHSRLKRHKIEQMIHFHHQQRLSETSPAGQATVYTHT